MNTVYLTILDDWLKSTPEQVTFFQTAYFIGALIGSSYGVVTKRSLQGTLFWSCLGLAGIVLGVIFVKSYIVFFGFAALQRALTLVGAICTRSLCQKDSEAKLLGRVMAFRSAVIDIVGILGYATSIFLFKYVSVPYLLAVAAGCFVVSAAISRQPSSSSSLSGRGV